MDVFFKNMSIKRLCNDEKHMVKKLGRAVARKLKRTLADLNAAQNLQEVKTGHPHWLRGKFDGCVAFSLDRAMRVVVYPLDGQSDQSGKILWSTVTSVRIDFVGDYHG